MADDVLRLLDEFAARWARGERPDAREYLERAGERQEELTRLLDRFLSLTPAPKPNDQTLTLAEAWVAGLPPLVELRASQGLKRDAVVDALMKALGLGTAKRDKVRRYYHQLETGLLEPVRVDRRVWEALASALRVRVDDLVGWRAHPAEFEPAYRASAEVAVSPVAPAAVPADRGPAEESDEVDRLFLGLPDSSM